MNSVQLAWQPEWPRTRKIEAALNRLMELGASVASNDQRPKPNFEIRFPVNSLRSAVDWIEVGYLLAQLGSEKYPEDFAARMPEKDRAPTIFAGVGKPPIIRARATPGFLALTLVGEA